MLDSDAVVDVAVGVINGKGKNGKDWSAFKVVLTMDDGEMIESGLIFPKSQADTSNFKSFK